MEFTKGNILRADTEAVVNTVNCVGFMGRGIAAQFKRVYPENFKAYEAACKRKEVVPGRMFMFETGQLTNPRFIVNFPTKRHWRGKSRIEDIESGLVALVEEVTKRGIKSIAIPPLGCGLGGLDWNDVRPLIERAFAALPDVRALVFEPNEEGPPDKMATTKEVPRMTPGRAVLVGLFEKYLAGLMDPAISLLEVHKLMYFAQEAGEPLRLKYVKAPYGPYAENLRHVLTTIEGYMISGYGDGGDAPEKPLELVPGAADDARAFLKDHPATLERFRRVVKLVEGFETSFGMELLATVHWVMTREGAGDRRAVADAVHAWTPRKQMFTEEQIHLTARRLAEEGWIGTGTRA
ncbi:type II toxin-antitoxin system antitoxin DNA ADP-ribosyl glycohydrolase DarG [Sorangium sp. So ce854]|uniref:type II toxin-antitoxin system antitoxin DNA ADP-ribosyl glycohydrolase DarG n=1 Tax=Sorangium sp. So ce854 TaxID=3133322 RepID=UPI003F5D6725